MSITRPATCVILVLFAATVAIADDAQARIKKLDFFSIVIPRPPRLVPDGGLRKLSSHLPLPRPRPGGYPPAAAEIASSTSAELYLAPVVPLD